MSLVMPDVKALEEAVEALDPVALREFRRWFAEFDAAGWDRQLESDCTAGKLDALLREAEDDYRNQLHRPLGGTRRRTDSGAATRPCPLTSGILPTGISGFSRLTPPIHRCI